MKVLEKTERRLGERLLLKAERCMGPKCAVVRRAYPPGVHGKKRRRGKSEFGTILQEKQKLRILYFLDDRTMKRYSQEATVRQGLYRTNLLSLLEGRLDNTVFRLGFAPTRRTARLLVSHGHILVNNRRTTVPSYHVRKGNEIRIRPQSLGKGMLADLEPRLKKIEPPKWLALDRDQKRGQVIGTPGEGLDEQSFTFDITRIREYYSR